MNANELPARLRTLLLTMLFAIGSLAGLAACDEGPVDEAGDAIDEAADEVEDAADEIDEEL